MMLPVNCFLPIHFSVPLWHFGVITASSGPRAAFASRDEPLILMNLHTAHMYTYFTLMNYPDGPRVAFAPRDVLFPLKFLRAASLPMLLIVMDYLAGPRVAFAPRDVLIIHNLIKCKAIVEYWENFTKTKKQGVWAAEALYFHIRKPKGVTSGKAGPRAAFAPRVVLFALRFLLVILSWTILNCLFAMPDKAWSPLLTTFPITMYYLSAMLNRAWCPRAAFASRDELDPLWYLPTVTMYFTDLSRGVPSYNYAR